MNLPKKLYARKTRARIVRFLEVLLPASKTMRIPAIAMHIWKVSILPPLRATSVYLRIRKPKARKAMAIRMISATAGLVRLLSPFFLDGYSRKANSSRNRQWDALRLTDAIIPNVENHSWNATQSIISTVITVFVFPV